MRKLVVGILAHVDAGKTTLSESMLYLSGKIRKMGRVDNKDAFLDTFELEKARGITIFSKQALLELGETQITLLDTPGHVDFSAEMERTLQVLDYAILVVSGADGVQGHTKTLWRLLELYQIPVFLFINKMDQNGTHRDSILTEIKKSLSDNCIDFGLHGSDSFYDQLAVCEERMLECYLKEGQIEPAFINESIRQRKVFPCFFGSALRLEGLEPFMQGIMSYTTSPCYPADFGAKVFKITRDEQGNRLAHMKITGGMLKVKDILTGGGWEEKINQIRLYSGQKYEAVNEIGAGLVCAVTGLSQIRAGDGLGIENASGNPVLEPVLSYQIILPDGCDPRAMIPKLRQLEEEAPELHIVWEEQLQEIQVQIMGEVQIEVLQSLIEERFGIAVDFGAGRIVYKETVANIVEGVGHFEPLRHYAEVHLLLQPGESGSGVQFQTACSDDVLGRSWQRLILTHLEEKTHRGVLTGSAITDMIITLVSGRSHNKHTEGGDFREATYRAVRQGLMEAESILLEPYYSFQLELPEKLVGKAMTDIEQMYGVCEITQTNGGLAVLTGSAPIATMKNYQQEVFAYTRGEGRLFCSLSGYKPCHNPDEVIAKIGYDSDRDMANPTGSVFCAHGTGFLVDWFEVKDYMHVESCFENKTIGLSDEAAPKRMAPPETQWISPEEVDKIISSTFYANQGKKSDWKQRRPSRESYSTPTSYVAKPKEPKEEYLLVDGYNVIFAWPDLKELSDINMESARTKLADILGHYQSIRKCKIILVFDAYRVQGHVEEVIDYYDIHLVYTREAQTADSYIEKFAHDNAKKYNIVVATSDGLQQIIIRGSGCFLLSARDLKAEINRAIEGVTQEYQEKQRIDRHYLIDALSPESKLQVTELMKNKNEG